MEKYSVLKFHQDYSIVLFIKNIPFSQQTIFHNFRKIKCGTLGQAALAVCFNKRSAMLLVFASPSSMEYIDIYNQHSCTRVLKHSSNEAGGRGCIFGETKIIRLW